MGGEARGKAGKPVRILVQTRPAPGSGRGGRWPGNTDREAI